MSMYRISSDTQVLLYQMKESSRASPITAMTPSLGSLSPLRGCYPLECGEQSPTHEAPIFTQTLVLYFVRPSFEMMGLVCEFQYIPSHFSNLHSMLLVWTSTSAFSQFCMWILDMHQKKLHFSHNTTILRDGAIKVRPVLYMQVPVGFATILQQSRPYIGCCR
jgi:hypothetical protein